MTNDRSAKDLRSLLKSVETAGWDYARIELDGLTIVVSKDGDPTIETRALTEGQKGEPIKPATAHLPEEDSIPEFATTEEVADPIDEPLHGDITTVGSPSIGLFWRSPKPGAPHFIEVGQVVTADDTLCIIEVMKLITHVKAGHDGTITRIHPSNGDMVEYATPLVDIARAK